MEIQNYDTSITYKEILLGYGYSLEIIGDWTEEQCEGECDAVNGEVTD